MSGCCKGVRQTDDAGLPGDGDEAGSVPCRGAKSLAAKAGAGLRWLAPATVLAIMPKCPVCLAAYLAMATGLGVSVTAAAYVRSGLILASAAALMAFAFGLVRKYLAKNSSG